MSTLRQSDARLVSRAAKGDEQAFAEIFTRHGQDIYRYCRAILGSPDDAQDALQNTMDRVLRALPGEERTIYLRPWLFRVARNESLTLIRNRTQTVELTDDSAPSEPAADIRAEHREEVRTLIGDLASLPETQRSALVLHELSGLSHDEISQALQRSPRASRQAVYEARIALADLKEGRDMHCDEVRAAISNGDGRVVRGRKIRSHLRDCSRCSDFALAIDRRHTQLGMLAPPLPAAAATGLIAAALGGGAAAGGLTGAGASAGVAGVVGGSVALKSAGVVAASLALGVGGAKVAGVDLPIVGSQAKSERASATSQQGAEPSGGTGSGGAPAAGDESAEATDEEERAANSAGSKGKGGKKEKAGPEKKQSRGAKNTDKPSTESTRSDREAEKADREAAREASKAEKQAAKDLQKAERQAEKDAKKEDKETGPPAHSNQDGNSAADSGPPSHSNSGGNGKKEK